MRPWHLPIALAAWATISPACVTRTPGAPDRPAGAVALLPWPHRDTTGLDRLVSPSPTVEERNRTVAATLDGELLLGRETSRVTVARAERAGCGVVREFRDLDPSTGRPVPRRPQGIEFVCVQPEEFRHDVPSSAPTGVPPTETVPFELSEPDGPVQGVLLHLSSLGGARYEGSVVEELRRRGWLVISSGAPWTVFRRRSFDATTDQDLEGAARYAAARTDARLATWALATEAVLEDLARRRPQIPLDRIALVGFSLGAAGGTTVAARIADRLRAAVLVGGGANLLSIARRSGLVSGETNVTWRGGKLPASVAARLDELYLAHSGLDPYHAAPALRAVPVLLFDAALDRTVPASTGDLLYERLGRPERWRIWGGHAILFWRLPAYAGEIADWIERASKQAGSPRGGPARALRTVPLARPRVAVVPGEKVAS